MKNEKRRKPNKNVRECIKLKNDQNTQKLKVLPLHSPNEREK